MQKWKKVLLWSVILIMLIGVSGCMSKGNDAIGKMLEHMNEKYDDQFTYNRPYGGGPSAKSKKIICSSEKFPDKDIWVMYQEDADGNVLIFDNYMGVKFEQQTRNLLNQTLTKVFGSEYKLFYTVNLQAATKGASNEMTFEEYIKEPSSSIGIVVIVKQRDGLERSDVEQELERAIQEAGLCCRLGTIYFDAGTGYYDEVTTETLSTYCNQKHYKECLQFSMDDISAFSSCEWR